MIDWDTIAYFTRGEFFTEGEEHLLLPGVEPAEELVRKLDLARNIATQKAGREVFFTITSGVRPPDTDLDDGELDSAHAYGYAADIRASLSGDRHFILNALQSVRFRRIGIYDRHLHADVSPVHDQDVTWLGKSR